MHKRILLVLTVVIIIIAAVIVYYKFSPTEVAIFPKCQFYVLTGWQCPGCGIQRAIHMLLIGDLNSAFQYNPLAILVLPYVLVGLICEAILFVIPKTKESKPKRVAQNIKGKLFGATASKITLVTVIIYFIGRNIL